MTNQRRIHWDQVVVLALAAVIGLYGGIAASLFSACIRAAQILVFRLPEVARDLWDPAQGWQTRFLRELAAAKWHVELPGTALAVLIASQVLEVLAERRQVRIPLVEAKRLRGAAFAGAFGLVLYYPLVLLGAFDRTFSDPTGGFLAIVRGAPPWLRVLAPALGGLAAGLLVRYVSPESGGHGVVEVIEGVRDQGSPQLRGRVALWKSLAAGAVIGSGGSAGREGPVVHLGGAVAAGLARALNLAHERAALLFACGAAAGISASFHAPLAGAMFALEIVLRDFTAPSLAPVVVSAVLAAVASRGLGLPGSDLREVQWALGNPGEIALYVAFGALCAVVALLYVELIDRAHVLFERPRLPVALRPALGGLCVGLLGLAAPWALGTGTEAMNLALGGGLTLGVLVAALAAKLVGTALTLGSGAPGGSFFPAVFCGAMLGGAFGEVAHALFPGIVTSPAAYVAVGMGGVVAGSSVAPLTGVLMMLELTRSDGIVLPLLVACGVSAAAVHRFLGGSVYELKLQERLASSHSEDDSRAP